MRPTDLELWRAFYLRPGEETFRPVYEETKALVQTLCLRILRDDSETGDAFQSTYCRLLLLARHKEKAREVDDFRRLVGRLAIREADRLRKRRNRRSVKERVVDAMDNVPARDLGIEDRVDRVELRRRIERVVDTLPEDQRVPLYLHYFHGLSQREVARSLGASSSTISYRIQQGVKRLQRSMAAAGLGDAVKVLGGIAVTARLIEPSQSAETVYASAVETLAAGGEVEWRDVSGSGGTSTATSPAASLLEIKSTWIAVALLLAAVLVVALRDDRDEAGSPQAPPDVRNPLVADSAPAAAGDVSAPEPAGNIEVSPPPRETVVEPEHGVVRGVVRDTDTKEPIPRAVVRAGDREFVADEGGEYVATGMDPGQLEMKAAADGYAAVPATLNIDPRETQYKDLFLDPAVEVSVLVVDTRGEPVAGARIVRSWYGCDGCFSLDEYDETDAGGRAILGRVSRLNPPNLNVYRDGYKTGAVEKESLPVAGVDQREVRVVLERPAFLVRVLAGRVTDPRGRPIAGAAIQYKDGQSTSFGPDVVYGEVQTTSDERGFYRLEFEDDYAECHLAVGAPGWAPVVRRSVRPGTPEKPAEVDFTLEPGHWLEGVIADEAGRPIEGVRIHAMPEEHLLNAAVAYPVALRHTKTDAGGSFRLEDVSGPTTALSLMGPSGCGCPRTEMGDVPVDQQVRLTLKSYGVLRGRVVDDATGEPVTEFNVKLDGYGISSRRVDPGESFSSPAGRFVLENLVQGSRFGVIVEADGYVDGYAESVEVVSKSSVDEVEIRLSDGRTLEGRIVDAASGLPVSGAQLAFGVYRFNADIDWTILENSRAFFNLQKGSTADDGAFRFREGAPGLLFIRAPGYCRLIIRPGERAKYGTASEALEIPLAPARKLEGVLTLDGQPVAGTGVGIARLAKSPAPAAASSTAGVEGDVAREWVGFVRTGEHGEFAWTEIAAGPYLLEILLITHPDQNYGVRIRRRVEVPPDMENRVDVGHDLGSISFSGRLLSPDGRPADRARLTIRPRFRWDYFEFAFDIAAQNRGEFLFPRLRPGLYDVEVVAGGEAGRRTRLGTIDLSEDTTRDVVLE